MICKTCNIAMANEMPFSKEKHEKYCKCPKCKAVTKHTLLNVKELNFREALHREYKK